MRYIILPMIIIFATTAFADPVGDKQLTSRAYVDTELENRQDKIPAAGKPGVAAGDTVMTYTTGGNGVIGERGIYSDATNYNANTDADKLITAAALNDTFNSLPTVETSTMVCANYPTCTLWTITDDTAYDPVTVMLNALINKNGTVYCYKNLSGTKGLDGACAPSKYGGWGAMFTYNNKAVQISGISACSSLPGTPTQIASNETVVQSDYEAAGSGQNMNTTSPGKYCYCKMTAPMESYWIMSMVTENAPDCANTCAFVCGHNVDMSRSTRRALFNSVQ